MSLQCRSHCNFEIAVHRQVQVSTRLVISAKKAETLVSVFHRRPFKFNARRHRGKETSCLAFHEHSSSTKAASVILNGRGARSHGVTCRCPRNPLTSAYTATTSASTWLLSLRGSVLNPPSHFRTHRSSHRFCTQSSLRR